MLTFQLLPMDNGDKTQLNIHFKLLKQLEPEITGSIFQGFADRFNKFLENMNTMILAN